MRIFSKRFFSSSILDFIADGYSIHRRVPLDGSGARDRRFSRSFHEFDGERFEYVRRDDRSARSSLSLERTCVKQQRQWIRETKRKIAIDKPNVLSRWKNDVITSRPGIIVITDNGVSSRNGAIARVLSVCFITYSTTVFVSRRKFDCARPDAGLRRCSWNSRPSFVGLYRCTDVNCCQQRRN